MVTLNATILKYNTDCYCDIVLQ